jgi:predicted flap endonuclease-1-like 5' DNA nuclease
MSSFACSWAWLLGGLLGGWLLWQLFDRFFRRDGEAAGMRVRRDLEAASARLTAVQAELAGSNDKAARLASDLGTAKTTLDATTSEFTAQVADWKARHHDVEGRLSLETAAAAAAATAATAAMAAEHDRYGALQAELNAARASLTSSGETNTRLSAEVADWKAKYTKVKDEVDAATVAAASAAAATVAATKAAGEGHAKLQAELTAAQEALAKVRTEHAASLAAHSKLAADHAAATTSLDTLTAEHAAARDAQGRMQVEFAAVSDSHGKVKAELATAAAALLAATSAQTALRMEVTTANESVTRLRAELAAATESSTRARSELATANDATGKLRAELASATSSLHARNEEAAGLSRELAACRARHDELSAEIAKTSARAASANAFAAAAEFGFTPRRNGKDDLLIIEGIGPKINELLLKDGINTFAALAAAPVERVQSILTAAGPNFRLANPASWARQATMCDAGAWAELREYQDTLRAGVDASRAARLHEEKWLAAAREHGFAPRRNGKDDLTIVEGIGPKINELLVAAGIDTFAKLAASTAAQVQAILDAAGPHFRLANPGSWAQQSAMCAGGRWTELRALQDTLRAGVDTERGA